jgi:hypothetical protein
VLLAAYRLPLPTPPSRALWPSCVQVVVLQAVVQRRLVWLWAAHTATQAGHRSSVVGNTGTLPVGRCQEIGLVASKSFEFLI